MIDRTVKGTMSPSGRPPRLSMKVQERVLKKGGRYKSKTVRGFVRQRKMCVDDADGMG